MRSRPKKPGINGSGGPVLHSEGARPRRGRRPHFAKGNGPTACSSCAHTAFRTAKLVKEGHNVKFASVVGHLCINQRSNPPTAHRKDVIFGAAGMCGCQEGLPTACIVFLMKNGVF